MQPKILITGAAGGSMGGTGNRLTRNLLKKGIPVRAFVRREDERSRLLQEHGASIAIGDLLNIQSLRKAMKGIDSLLEATATMAEAVKEEGVKFILNLSKGSASDESPSPTGRRHWLSEKILDWSGVPTCHLRPGVFYENLFRAKGIREKSELRAPFGTGDGKVRAIAAHEVARLASVAMQKPQQSAGKTLLVFGSVLSLNEVGHQLTWLLKKPIHYRAISPEEWIKEAEGREGNENAVLIDHLVNLWEGILLLNQTPGLTGRLPELGALFNKLTDQSPLPLDEWVSLNRGH